MVSRANFDMMMARRREGKGGWIGVDLDGTLAEYYEWTAWNDFGSPILPMVYRIRRFLGEGHTVKILTARVGARGGRFVGDTWVHSDVRDMVCRHTGVKFSNAMMAQAIGDYTEKHVGDRLLVTCIKDFDMIELWDDRCIQVEANTGRTVFDEFEAEYNALMGKP